MIPPYGTPQDLFCAMRGYHLELGFGCGTSESTMLWPGHCRDCGIAIIRRPRTAQRDGPGSISGDGAP